MKTADYMLLQGIAYATDIGKRGSMPYRPLVSLPSVGEQFDKFFGGGGSSGSSAGEQTGPVIAASTHPQRKDAQPSRAASPNPASIQNEGIEA